MELEFDCFRTIITYVNIHNQLMWYKNSWEVWSPFEMEDVDDLPLEKLYENFSQSKSSENIVRSFQALKSRLNLNSLHGLDLYRALREKLSTHWKARDVFQLLEKRANQKEYLQQTAAKGVRVFIVGAGPIGLRQAIECILLGAEVIVVEKRSSFSRNNVLHLWPCTIEDLRQLGAKKFYGKFCAGAIDHISELPSSYRYVHVLSNTRSLDPWHPVNGHAYLYIKL